MRPKTRLSLLLRGIVVRGTFVRAPVTVVSWTAFAVCGLSCVCAADISAASVAAGCPVLHAQTTKTCPLRITTVSLNYTYLNDNRVLSRVNLGLGLQQLAKWLCCITGKLQLPNFNKDTQEIVLDSGEMQNDDIFIREKRKKSSFITTLAEGMPFVKFFS